MSEGSLRPLTLARVLRPADLPPVAPVRLSELTTLGLGGPARGVVTVETPADLPDALAGGPTLIVGGGSNLVVADAGVDATVVRMAIPGLRTNGDLVTIGAGEDWDGVVGRLVEAGYCGLAPLSGIPGSSGATPVQNVGAYGTELSDLLDSVTVYDRQRGEFVNLPSEALGLGYRCSNLRGSDRRVVVELTLRLGRAPRPVRYAELARRLGIAPGETAPEREVRAAVLALRRAKGMLLDPADPDTRSVGSFFTNPILDGPALAQTDRAIKFRLGPVEYPHYPAPGGATKLSAAWLIERAGFGRGYPHPAARIGISTKHTLALVNRGGTTDELLTLARDLRNGVQFAFAVELQPEPLLIGISL